MWWSWRGAVALILAACVGVAFLISMFAVSFQDETVSTQGAALLNALGGAIVGCVATWIGTSAERPERTRTMTDKTTPDPASDPANDPKHDLTEHPQDTGEPAVTPVPTPPADSVDGSGFIPSQNNHQGDQNAEQNGDDDNR